MFLRDVADKIAERDRVAGKALATNMEIDPEIVKVHSARTRSKLNAEIAEVCVTAEDYDPLKTNFGHNTNIKKV